MIEMRCLIIEDEQPAIELLTDYIDKLQDWVLVKVCRNPIEAMDYLRSNEVDILFVDIEMPKISGIELLQSLSNPPVCIITSAYSEYGVKAYDLNVFDYLLKPYSFSRFLKTYNRFNEEKKAIDSYRGSKDKTYLILREKGQKKRVTTDEIIYIESQRAYVSVHTLRGNIRTKMSLSSLMEALPQKDFIQVHRSYVIAIDKIDSYNGTEILLEGTKIPIGRYFKRTVEESLETRN